MFSALPCFATKVVYLGDDDVPSEGSLQLHIHPVPLLIIIETEMVGMSAIRRPPFCELVLFLSSLFVCFLVVCLPVVCLYPYISLFYGQLSS